MIGETIKKERERAGLSQQELAEAIGISRAKLSLVEADCVDNNGNKRYLNTEELFRCADVLKVSPSYLLTGNGDDNRQCAAEDLGLSDQTISNLRQMDDQIRQGFELLINDDLFGMALVAFLSDSNQGLFLNGNRIARSDEEIDLGNITEYHGSFRVGQVVEYVKEQEIISILRQIKGGSKK